MKYRYFVLLICCMVVFVTACGQTNQDANVVVDSGVTQTAPASVPTESVPSPAPTETTPALAPAETETVSAVVTPTAASAGVYEPVSSDVCQILQEDAAQALSTSFQVEEAVPFTDPLTGETGFGCSLTATGTGADFSDPAQVVANLVNAFVGWTEQPAYQANGPNGAAAAMTRDMGLLLISAAWEPSPEAQCPEDQPLGACDLQPEQKLYTIQVQAAQK